MRLRLLGAGGVAIILLIVLALLGPSRQEVRRRFEFSGAEGPLKLMPELAIEKGEDLVEQLPKYYRENPPPPEMKVVQEMNDPDVQNFVPLPEEPSPPSDSETAVDVIPDPDLDLVDQVEMHLPQQTNPWFVLLRMVRPLYPSNATPEERRTPLISVEVAFFVDAEGKVSASYILSTTGGPAFTEVVLKAVNQWLYKPVKIDGEASPGFWNRLIIRFRSPYLKAQG